MLMVASKRTAIFLAGPLRSPRLITLVRGGFGWQLGSTPTMGRKVLTNEMATLWNIFLLLTPLWAYLSFTWILQPRISCLQT
jgi:hypothetical protein